MGKVKNDTVTVTDLSELPPDMLPPEAVEAVSEALEGGKKKKRYEPKYTKTSVLGQIVKDDDPVAQEVITDGDLVDVWERRLLNPDHRDTPPIRLKTPNMTPRWINLAAPGRYQRAKYEQGWTPVKKEVLVDPREIYGVSYTAEGYVCRGDKQQEMLMMMPTAVWNKIQKRRAELNKKSYEKLKEQMSSAGYKHFEEKYGNKIVGEQAAEAASRFVGSVRFGTERVSQDDE